MTVWARALPLVSGWTWASASLDERATPDQRWNCGALSLSVTSSLCAVASSLSWNAVVSALTSDAETSRLSLYAEVSRRRVMVMVVGYWSRGFADESLAPFHVEWARVQLGVGTHSWTDLQDVKFSVQARSSDGYGPVVSSGTARERHSRSHVGR